VEIEGPVKAVTSFNAGILDALPTAALVSKIRREPLPASDRSTFTIIKESTDGPLAVSVPEDRGVCRDCATEITDPRQRRFEYPLSSCTLCGPRYTVIRSMPFVREQTSLVEFALCQPCRSEFEHPGDRRFHAQTTACPDCGPRIWATAGKEKRFGAMAIAASAAALNRGEILCLRGIGGYQLLVDATNAEAVDRLRQRKRRCAKPLAVMVPSLEQAEQLAYFDVLERNVFTSAAAPIILVRARTENGRAE
jgi:hydrogenase maturation protein HypF